jgi:hypothetical protein
MSPVTAAAVFALALATFPVFAAGDRPSIGIFLDFDSIPTSVALERMKRELKDLLKPSGLEPAFLDDRHGSAAQHGNMTFAGLLVVRFKGRCSVERWRPEEGLPAAGPVPLASTLVEQGHVLPFSEVECDQLRRSLSALNPRAGRRQQQALLGIALGRVVAHELYHVLARTTSHAAEGLAKATHSLKDLVGSALSFRDQELHSMLVQR